MHPGNKPLPDVAPYIMTRAFSTSEHKAQAKDAVAGAAITVLSKLYKNPAKPNPNASTVNMLALAGLVDSTIRSYTNANNLDFRSAGYVFGVDVARKILTELEIKSTDLGTDAGTYMPNTNQPYYFDDEPSHPVRPRPINPNDPELGTKATRPYHGPFYGTTAAILGTTMDWKLADPYVKPSNPPILPPDPSDLQTTKYLEAVEDVHRMGGIAELSTTKRNPTQTTDALFWAYDGANLIGTPPRLYNQIVRQIAYDKSLANAPIDSDINNAEIARLFALVNVALTDAGIFCWREKWRYELWRPLSGVRSDPTGPAPGGFGRPTWRVLGAPATNSNDEPFKPVFPGYPSGHATFGAAAFQTVRRFYHARDGNILTSPTLNAENADGSGDGSGDISEKQYVHIDAQKGSKDKTNEEPFHEFHGNDSLSFNFVSDELNGISRELYQPYIPSKALADQAGDVRTRVTVRFPSLKQAIFSNAISRIWLGVHWHFDAFAGEDVHVPFDKTTGEGRDNNPQRPTHYDQLYQVDSVDGTTKYKSVESMDWFGTMAAREGDSRQWWYGGVPLGMLIADDVFSSGMKFVGSLQDLSKDTPVVRV